MTKFTSNIQNKEGSVICYTKKMLVWYLKATYCYYNVAASSVWKVIDLTFIHYRKIGLSEHKALRIVSYRSKKFLP